MTACSGPREILVEGEPLYSGDDRLVRRAYHRVYKLLVDARTRRLPVSIPRAAAIDTIIVDRSTSEVTIRMNEEFGFQPFREESVSRVYDSFRGYLGRRFRKYAVQIESLGRPITELVPNEYRSELPLDLSRRPTPPPPEKALVIPLDRPITPSKGLQGRNIAIWPSHGWYYEYKLDRWEWMRARVFQTVEDLLPMAFVVPFVAPMLENAGANVFIPRERDLQTHEVIVDNDSDGDDAYIEYIGRGSSGWTTGLREGFATGLPPYRGSVNPFMLGTHRISASRSSAGDSVWWVPEIPERGHYGVYVSYGRTEGLTRDAIYTVHHTGGRTRFVVDQTMSGGTWVYLGEFLFEAGRNVQIGRISLSGGGDGNALSADAVRLGGGMGNIERGGTVSGKPRYAEAARYYMQYAGMPSHLVYNVTETLDDYRDDYQGRGEWVNFLRGAPYGPNKDRDEVGLGIPIDLSLAFHTDAGYSRSDTTIGTLLIYSSVGADTATTFPDGRSRFANRDFADILQTGLIEDVRALYDAKWRRRALWDKRYSEAVRPNVPAALLELLSHHNFLDMKFALDPAFRFHASRSIYKAILKFLSGQYERDAIVQPLPVSHVAARWIEDDRVYLTWQPVEDPLESSATPDRYVVYTRIEDGGFDNGRVVNQAQVTIDGLATDVIYSFKVAAANEGGTSFPSEIVSVCRRRDDLGTVAIVNGFDRVDAPATLEVDSLLGFADWWDQGVPWGYDFSYTGSQYDFDATSKWIDDDAPGHGASHATYETKLIAGNTFDFAYRHGQSIRAAGYSFVTASDESVIDESFALGDYTVVDLILGEEKRSIGPAGGPRKFEALPEPLRHKLTEAAESGVGLLLTGAYIGTDLLVGAEENSSEARFARQVLHIKHRTNYAVTNGEVWVTDTTFAARMGGLTFQTDLGSDIYAVEAPDAIEPSDSVAVTLMRYRQNNTSAVVGYRGEHNALSAGFPFEAIIERPERDWFMRHALRYLTRTPGD